MAEKRKSHVSYPKELRAKAKSSGLGLVTVHVLRPDGTPYEYQAAVDVEELRFAAWAGALVARPDIRPLPDLEVLVAQTHPDKLLEDPK